MIWRMLFKEDEGMRDTVDIRATESPIPGVVGDSDAMFSSLRPRVLE